MKKAVEEYGYYKGGDIIIGGIFTVNLNMDEFPIGYTDPTVMFCNGALLSNYKYFLDFRFAIEEVNRNPYLLPNVTLGYYVSDSCTNANKAVKSTIQILSGPRATVPNYNCMKDYNIAGFIGDLSSVTTLPIAQVLNVYGYTQISYGATDPLLGDRTMYPYLFRTAHNDHVYFSAILKLLKHFSWSWVGIVTSEDDSGIKESQTLTSFLNSHDICVEFTTKIASKRLFEGDERIRTEHFINQMNKKTISNSSSNIILICGTVSFYMASTLMLPDYVLRTKTFILPPSWFANNELVEQVSQAFNCCLGFLYTMDARIEYNRKILKDPYETGEMTQFIMNVHPSKFPDDKMLEDVWMTYYHCLSTNPYKNRAFQFYYKGKLFNCSGDEDIIGIPYSLFNIRSPAVYYAVLSMAYALDALLVSVGKDFHRNKKKSHKYRHKLNQHLRRIYYDNGLDKRFYYDEKGEMNTVYVIYNWMRNRRFLSINYMGSFMPWATPDKQLHINTSLVTWKNKEVGNIPRSQCSENCPPGSRKIKNNQKPICCYDCVKCHEGEISNITDSENCIKCLPIEWSSDKRDQCLLKREEFLAYSDSLAIILMAFSLLFWTICLLILGIFVSHKDSPIVKANNKTLSFILLISLSLCFLCVFFFIGRPVDRTCRLRQIVFGIIFSISVSSVLAKTIMVYMAFRISRPGSRWKKLIGVKVSNSIVVVASSIEVIISIFWLYFSPPYLEQDTHSYHRKVIIQCNEGSQVGFFAVLGYLFVLAAVSFTVAYLARTLPDRFNEAKYITFSMLVFCSVWITMVPSYLSTKGKNMVAVEIFSILASSAGLLGIIFFPKCYIIFLKPEMNTKSRLYNS
ncbi:vomeronasal type-2 receptor 26-like [Dendropsophus ebraccatus]|uniref:vomeronasal type-2 receptor 26-like n=1 Tax=Dendropsophus ebraccatus TaxID=150705 RepID=UPI003831F740